MGKTTTAFLSFFFAFLLFAPSAFAGGGRVLLDATPNIPGIRLHPGEFYTVRATVWADDSHTIRCQQCPIAFKFQNSNPTDVTTPDSTSTDQNGLASAKMVSNILGDRLVYVEVQTPDGSNHESSYYVLGYNQPDSGSPPPTVIPPAPEMVYPQDRQTLDLEGAYMFKVNPVNGASGYLYGLFQNGEMLYENYRDSKTLTGTEFALWESNPFHSKFKTGEVKVMIRALVNNQWTDAREITIYLKPRNSSQIPQTQTSKPTTVIIQKLPVFQPSQTLVVTQDSTASAELQKKVEELEQKLEESNRRQSALEKRLEELLNWIKSIFPFFNRT